MPNKLLSDWLMYIFHVHVLYNTYIHNRREKKRSFHTIRLSLFGHGGEKDQISQASSSDAAALS